MGSISACWSPARNPDPAGTFLPCLSPRTVHMAEQLDALGGGSARVGKLELFVRVRPAELGSDSCLQIGGDEAQDTVRLRDPNHPSSTPRSFPCTRVFRPEAAQQDVFTLVGLPIVDWLWDGFSALLLGYGQTGTGKTHTLLGQKNPALDNDGLLVKIVEALLKRRDQGDNGPCTLGLQCGEVLGESTVDLLSKDSSSISDLCSTPAVRIKSLAEATAVLAHCQRASLNWRQKSATGSGQPPPNKAHSFVRVLLHWEDMKQVSSLTVVDPIGFPSLRSPAVSSTQYVGSGVRDEPLDRRRGREDLRSLSALSRLLSEVSQHCEDTARGKGHEARLLTGPRTTLTNYIAPCLTANCKTFLLATISSASEDYLDSVNTLRVAARARSIMTPCLREQLQTFDRFKWQPVRKVLPQGSGRSSYDLGETGHASTSHDSPRSSQSSPLREKYRGRKERQNKIGHKHSVREERHAAEAGVSREYHTASRKSARLSPRTGCPKDDWKRSNGSERKETPGGHDRGSPSERMASPKQVEDWDLLADMAKLDSLLSPDAASVRTNGSSGSKEGLRIGRKQGSHSGDRLKDRMGSSVVEQGFADLQMPGSRAGNKGSNGRERGLRSRYGDLESPQESLTPSERASKQPASTGRARPRKVSALLAMEGLEQEFSDVFSKLKRRESGRTKEASVAAPQRESDGRSERGPVNGNSGAISDGSREEAELASEGKETAECHFEAEEGQRTPDPHRERSGPDRTPSSSLPFQAFLVERTKQSSASTKHTPRPSIGTCPERVESKPSNAGSSMESGEGTPKERGKSALSKRRLSSSVRIKGKPNQERSPIASQKRTGVSSEARNSPAASKVRSSIDKLDRQSMAELTKSVVASVADHKRRKQQEEETISEGVSQEAEKQSDAGTETPPAVSTLRGIRSGIGESPQQARTAIRLEKGTDVEERGSHAATSAPRELPASSSTHVGSEKGLEHQATVSPTRAKGVPADGLESGALLELLRRERKARAETEERVAELENDLLQSSTGYSIKIDDLRLELHKARAQCRALEAASPHAVVFAQYHKELQDLRAQVRELRKEIKEICARFKGELVTASLGHCTDLKVTRSLTDFGGGTFAQDTCHITTGATLSIKKQSMQIAGGDCPFPQSTRKVHSSACATNSRLFEVLQRQAKQLRKANESMERELAAARDESRHLTAQKGAAEDAIRRSEGLARKVSQLEADLEALQLRERAAVGGMQHAQRAAEQSKAAEGQARQECAGLGKLAQNLREEIHALKRARRQDQAVGRMTARQHGVTNGSPTKRRPRAKLPFETLARLQRSLDPHAKRSQEIVNELSRELASFQQHWQEERMEESAGDVYWTSC